MTSRLTSRFGFALAIVTSGCWIVAGLEDRPVGDGAADASMLDGAADAPFDAPFDAPIDAPIDALTDAGARCPATNAFGALERRSDLSTPQDELGITLTPDELTAYVGSGQLSVPSSSLFVTTRSGVSALFPAARKLEGQGTAINSGPNIAAAGDELFFARAFPDGGSRTAFDLFVGVPDMDAASPGLQGVQPLAALNAPDARTDEQDAFFIADRKAFYFSSDRDGTSRIYRSERSGGSFAAPTLVLKTLTTGVELSPKVTSDELTIYFAGNPPGMPLAFQIYMATRSDASADFGTPTMVPALSNGASLDFPGWLSPDGCTIYFLSNRAGGSGGFDVYRAVKQR